MRSSIAWLVLVASLVGAPLASSQSFSRQRHPSDAEQRLYPAGTRVLIISVAHYARRDVWPDLSTDRDAKRIHDLFIGRGLRESDIGVIRLEPLRGTAMKPVLLADIDTFARSLPAEDPGTGIRRGLRLIVYFAGHGYSRHSASGHARGYLMLPDAPDPGVASDYELGSVALEQSEFLRKIASLDASDTLVLLDACFSGLGLEQLEREADAPERLSPSDPQRIFQVITAGQADKTVPDDNLFSGLVAAGLDGAADIDSDGWITGTELGEYLRMSMTQESIMAGRTRQTPMFETYTGPEIEYTVRGETRFASPQRLSAQAIARVIGASSQPVSAFRDCDACPYLRIVPAPPNPAGESPYLAVGIHDVTIDEYQGCFQAGGCEHWPRTASESPGDRPVTDVSRDDARQYTRWLSCITGKSYRLPTDAEWEYLAAPEVRLLRAASTPHVARANCRGCGSPWDGREPAPAEAFRPGTYGLFDLLGNVWQWVDCDTVRSGVPCGSPAHVRGGAFSTRYAVVESLPTGTLSPITRDNNIGFRVARELQSAKPEPVDCALAMHSR